MYGDATENLQESNSDSEVVINKPVSKVNTPAHYDSSSEDSMLNERIAKRSDSDWSVAMMASTKPKQKRRKTAVNTSRTSRSKSSGENRYKSSPLKLNNSWCTKKQKPAKPNIHAKPQ